MLADGLRAMSEYPAWWFALNYNETSQYNRREDISRLSCLLGYEQDVLMLIFEIAGLVTRKSGGGHVVRVDKWVSMFGEYELTNELSRNSISGVFGGKPTYYLRVGRLESPFLVKEQMRNERLKPPRISRMKLSRIMQDTVSNVLINLKSRDLLTGGHFGIGVDDVEESNAVEMEVEQERDNLGDDDTNKAVIFDGGVSLKDMPDWLTRTNTINQSLFPILSRFGATISNVELSSLLSELVKFYKNLEKDMNFTYKNGREGLLLEVPRNASSKYRCFRTQSGRIKWFNKFLRHVGGGTDEESANEGAYVVTRELCNEYETSTLLALKEHGIPVLEKMDEVTAGAMWSDAQITLYQQRKLLKYMRYSFGSKVMIPETTVRQMGVGYVPPEFGIYNYQKTPSTKPEKCNYWTRSLPTLLKQSTEQLLQEQCGKRSATSAAYKNHTLKPYLIGNKLGWELIVGADHGKGAWRSVVKVYHADYPTRRAQEEERKICWTDKRMDDERGYFLLRNGHIDCKKDNEEILRNTVMCKMREDFTKILSSRMLGLEINSQFEVFLISKYSQNIKVVSKNHKSCVSYEIADIKHKLATKIVDETNLPCGAEICLDIPQFTLYFTGDLAFYADILGKPHSSPHWCHLCDLSYKEWNDVSNLNKGNMWSIKTMQETYNIYKQQRNNAAIKGIKNEMHFPNISPQNFVCPPLHVTIGLVNKIWNQMTEWINDDLEDIEETEAKERGLLSITNTMLGNALKTRDETGKTKSIELKHQKVQRKQIEKQLLKTTDLLQIQILQSNLSRIDVEIKALTSFVNNSKKLVDTLKNKIKLHKDRIVKLRKERGWNVDSVLFTIECILKTYHIEVQAYHGGDFNGVSCRALLDHVEEIMSEIKKAVISGRKKPSNISDAEVHSKLDKYEDLLKMLDSTLSQMMIVNPTQSEINEFEKRKNKTMKLWRGLNISITTKVHLLECHALHQLQTFKGIIDKAEHHAKREHQVGARLLAVTRNIKRFDARVHSQLKTMEIASNSEVKKKQQEVLMSTKRKNQSNVSKSQLRKRNKVQIKVEKRNSSATKDRV